MKLRQIREAQKRKNKNNISQMRERLCRLTYLYADGPIVAEIFCCNTTVAAQEIFQLAVAAVDSLNMKGPPDPFAG